MPRPKNPNPKVRMHVVLPQETMARLRIKFSSEDNLKGIVHGAISAFIDAAINEKFEREINANRQSDVL
jgi:hypothetical protein